MNNERFNARSDAPAMNKPGVGDDVACSNCGEVALDTGLECDECGFDNSEILTGKKWHATKPTPPAQPASVQFKCTVVDDQNPNGVPLEQWGTPSQRTWVGLTDEQTETIEKMALTKNMAIAMTAATLKEKNT